MIPMHRPDAWGRDITRDAPRAHLMNCENKEHLIMNELSVFQKGDGAHCGLTDWYPECEAALTAALATKKPFSTGWYRSKKEIASAIIWSIDGDTIRIEVEVSDDFDTEGKGYADTKEWTVEAIQQCIDKAWDTANRDLDNSAPYVGFSVIDDKESWFETYLMSTGEYDTPPGDYYHWWGWQHDENDKEEGIPDPRIPVATVKAFEEWAHHWAWGQERFDSLTIDGFTIKPWKSQPPAFEDPNDYVGMGWTDDRGRP